MRVQQSRRVQLLLLSVVTLVSGGYFLSLRHTHVNSLQNIATCAPPLGNLLEGKTRRQFSLNYESTARSDWGALMASQTPSSKLATEPSLVTQKLALTLQAEWSVALVQKRDDRVLLSNSLRSLNIQMKHNDVVNAEQNQELISQLSKTFYIEMTPEGEVLSLQSDPSLRPIEKNILRWIVAHFQTTVPRNANASVNDWTTAEYDPNGQYEAQYHFTAGTHSGSFQLEKVKSKYIALNSGRRQRKRKSQFDLNYQIEIVSKSAGEFQCAPGVFQSFAGSEVTKTKVSENLIAESHDLFKLEFKGETPVNISDRKNLLTEYQSLGHPSSFRLVTDDSQQDMERLIQKTELGELTEAKLLTLLTEAKKSEDPKAIDALYLKFKALVYLHPESCAKLGDLLATEDPTSKVMMILTTALSSVGSPEAQTALISALNSRAENLSAVQALAPALGMTDQPTVESEKALRALIQNSKQEGIVTTAGLSLGAMAGHLADDFPVRQKEIVDGIRNDYEHADNSVQKKFLVSVLGNAGSAESLPVIMDALKAPDPGVQAEAAMALRFVPGKEAEEQLFKILCENTDEGVRRSAANSLGYREPVTLELSEKLRAAFAKQESELVRRDLVKDVFEVRNVDPQVKEWLRHVKDTDPAQSVRQIAQDYYGLSGG